MIDCFTVQDRLVPAHNAAPPEASLAAFRPALIWYFRRKTRDTNDVEDLTQEVFLRIAARSGGEVENLGGYIFQTAASVLADRHRRRTVRHADNQILFDGDRHGGTDFDAARISESRELLHAVAVALTELPERTRAIFLLRRLEGHSYKAIAAKFGISVSAVEKRMVRAVRHLCRSPECWAQPTATVSRQIQSRQLLQASRTRLTLGQTGSACTAGSSRGPQ